MLGDIGSTEVVYQDKSLFKAKGDLASERRNPITFQLHRDKTFKELTMAFTGMESTVSDDPAFLAGLEKRKLERNIG